MKKLFLIPKGQNGLPLHPIANIDECMKSYEKVIIDIPSEEEIENYLKTFPYTKHLDDGQYNDGVICGAELGIQWILNKIQIK